MVDCWLPHRHQNLSLGEIVNSRKAILSWFSTVVMLCSLISFVEVTQVSAATKPSPKASPNSQKISKKISKKTPKKAVQRKRKISKPLPSPPAKWPPKGFKEINGVYISSPDSIDDAIGRMAPFDSLLSQVQICYKKSCAIVYVASEKSCRWWEVRSIVVGRYADVLGDLRTLAKGSKAREVKTIILVSKEPVEDYAEILNMKAFCRNDAVTGKIPSNTFTPNPELTPAPATSASASASASPSPTAS